MPNLEELQEKELVSEDDASMSSVVRPSPALHEKREKGIMFSAEVEQAIITLRGLVANEFLGSS